MVYMQHLMEITTDKADRCVMEAEVFEKSMAWVWFSDTVLETQCRHLSM